MISYMDFNEQFSKNWAFSSFHFLNIKLKVWFGWRENERLVIPFKRINWLRMEEKNADQLFTSNLSWAHLCALKYYFNDYYRLQIQEYDETYKFNGFYARIKTKNKYYGFKSFNCVCVCMCVVIPLIFGRRRWT